MAKVDCKNMIWGDNPIKFGATKRFCVVRMTLNKTMTKHS